MPKTLTSFFEKKAASWLPSRDFRLFVSRNWQTRSENLRFTFQPQFHCCFFVCVVEKQTKQTNKKLNKNILTTEGLSVKQ